MHVMLCGKGAQMLKYVTDLDWDNVTTWTDFFLALKVCLANIIRLFIQQSHGQGHQH